MTKKKATNAKAESASGLWSRAVNVIARNEDGCVMKLPGENASRITEQVQLSE